MPDGIISSETRFSALVLLRAVTGGPSATWSGGDTCHHESMEAALQRIVKLRRITLYGDIGEEDF